MKPSHCSAPARNQDRPSADALPLLLSQVALDAMLTQGVKNVKPATLGKSLPCLVVFS